MAKKSAPTQPAGDLLWGLSAIAKHIERTVRQTQYLVETDKIPVERLGPKLIVGSRQKIDSHLRGDNSE